MDFMQRAIDKARAGIKQGQSPFGACVVKDGEIVACEHNTVWKNNNPTEHAEMNSIREASKKLGSIDLSGCNIYSTTEPCPMCFSAIHWARIAEIVYGASIADAKKAGFNELQISDQKLKKLGKSSVRIKPGVKKDKCVGLFHEWENSGGKSY
jgi:tRNA(Arg) A34 adenosine deaminase TadA